MCDLPVRLNGREIRRGTMKKRILAVLLSVLTVVTVLAGCGSEKTEDRERRRESRRTEDEGETKDKKKNPSKRQIEEDQQILSAIATEAMEAWTQKCYANVAMVINLGTVHETGKETTATGMEDEFLSKFWELDGSQSFEGIKEKMNSDITNIEIVFSLDPDSYSLTVQAYNSDGPCFDPIYVH